MTRGEVLSILNQVVNSLGRVYLTVVGRVLVHQLDVLVLGF